MAVLPGQVDYLANFSIGAMPSPQGTLGVTDPAYLGLLRQVQQQVAQLYQSTQADAQRVQRDANLARPRIIERAERDRQSAVESASDRGMLLSGAAQKRFGEMRAAETEALGSLDLATADNLAGLASRFQSELGRISTGLAESEVGYAQAEESRRRQAETEGAFLAEQQALRGEQAAQWQQQYDQASMFQQQNLDLARQQNEAALAQQEQWYERYLAALRGETYSAEPGYRPQGLRPQGTSRSTTRAV